MKVKISGRVTMEVMILHNILMIKMKTWLKRAIFIRNILLH
jgi:hypothetical protein